LVWITPSQFQPVVSTGLMAAVLLEAVLQALLL
jgi:hypothetical protein